MVFEWENRLAVLSFQQSKINCRLVIWDHHHRHMVLSCCIGTLGSLFKNCTVEYQNKNTVCKKKNKSSIASVQRLRKKNRSIVKPGPIRSARSCYPSPERTLKLKRRSCSIISLMVEQPNSKTNGRPWGIVYSIQCVYIYIYM